MSEVFALKRVQYRGRDVSILTQNENGPCPLIAIANVLLLSRRLELGPRHLDRGFIPLSDLTNLVGEVVLQCIGRSGAAQEHQGQLVASVVELLPKLARGLDVNVKFSKCTALEFTEELSLFDALGIQLLHGWLVDPEERRIVNAIGDKSYNALVNEVVEYRASSSASSPLSDSPPHPSSPSGAVIDSFLRDSASQLTYTGLVELHKSLQEGELAVFFRNNHFSTLVKHNAQLYCLVTDCAFLDEADIAWELLADVDGADSAFFSSGFSRFVPKNNNNSSSSSSPLIDIASLNFDHVVGAASQSSQQTQRRPPSSPFSSSSSSSSSSYSSRQPGATIALPPVAPSSGGEEDEASMRLARELERQDREAADHSAALCFQQLEWDALQRQQHQQHQQHQQYQQQRAAQQSPPQNQGADQGGLCVVS